MPKHKVAQECRDIKVVEILEPKGEGPKRVHLSPEQERDAAAALADHDISVAAFNDDLPNLIKKIPGSWVAYHHGKKVASARDRDELLRKVADLKPVPYVAKVLADGYRLAL